MMTEILTSAQMRAAELAAIDSGTVSGLELMERAGRAVVQHILSEWPQMSDGPRRASVLCGPGNNGGDGFVVARLLAAKGWSVDTVMLGEAGRLPPDAKANHDRWIAEGGLVHPWQALVDAGTLAFRQAHPSPSLVVDALFGTGLTRPLGDLHSQLQLAIDPDDSKRPRLVAVDIPSGLCADSGRLLGRERLAQDNIARGQRPFVLAADLTVTFHRMKPGHLLADGPDCCGKVAVADIGLPCPNAQDLRIARRVAMPSAALLDKHGGHKFDHGHALVLSGGLGRSGAARLAARGALRIGVGLVTLGVPAPAIPEVASQITALMLARIDSTEDLVALLRDRRLTALCLGPGLGTDESTHLLVDAALDAHRPMVLDADALTHLAHDPALADKLHTGCVLTPHDGEFARLFPDLADMLKGAPTQGPAPSKLDAARAAARRVGCVVLMKGADTVIAAPDGACRINACVYDDAAPWLATAGAGDVLAGFITGLMARGFPPFDSACLGAWLHAECACRFGPGLIAEDLPEMLPVILSALRRTSK